MQVRQKGLKTLSHDILAKIMGYLNQRDLLNMRLVSRHFSSLTHMQDLQLEWDVGTADASASLSLFAFRHCMGSGDSAPNLAITVGPDESDFSWPSLVLALSCSHLTAVRCESWDLTLLQAQLLLRIAPPQLTSLGLAAPPLILEDSNWQRFSMLTHLVQNLPENSSIVPSGPDCGIAGLPLKSYSHRSWHDEGCQLFPDGFRLPSVEVLNLYGDPFPADMTFPAVQEIHICVISRDILTKYAWFSLQALHLCAFSSSEGTASLLEVLAQCARRIACQHLVLEGLFCRNCPLHGPDLFEAVRAMPRLSALSLQQGRCQQSCNSCGSLQEYQGPTVMRTSLANYTAALMTVTVQCQGPFRLRMQDATGMDAEVDLHPNGHVTMCMCSTCCPAT